MSSSKWKKKGLKIKQNSDLTFASTTIARINDLLIGNQTNVYSYTLIKFPYMSVDGHLYKYFLFMQFKFKFDDDDQFHHIVFLKVHLFIVNSGYLCHVFK